MSLSHLLPPIASTYGADVDRVFWLIFTVVGVWFVAAEAFLVTAIVRNRRGRHPRADYVRGENARQLAWVMIPAAIVLVLDLGIDHAGATAWEKVKGAPPASNQLIRITGKQFNWNFTYAGPDGKFGTADDVSSENDLHVPVGSPIRFELRSDDVVHSFFVPTLRLKQDVVPGRVIPGWFEVTAPGTYEIACAELCGFSHYSMRGQIIAMTPRDYAAWVNENWPAKTASAAASAKDN